MLSGLLRVVQGAGAGDVRGSALWVSRRRALIDLGAAENYAGDVSLQFTGRNGCLAGGDGRRRAGDGVGVFNAKGGRSSSKCIEV